MTLARTVLRLALPLAVFGLMFALAACSSDPDPGADVASDDPGAEGNCQEPGCRCCALPELEVTADVFPYDVEGPVTQCAYDGFAWQSFFYLNWPAKAGDAGSPDTSLPFGARDAAGLGKPVVWETYAETVDVFLKDAANPCPGVQNGDDAAIEKCWQGLYQTTAGGRFCAQANGQKTLTHISKQPGHTQVLTDFVVVGPTVAQSGYYARAEALMNYDVFEYIVSNQYYDAEVQSQASAIDFAASNAETGTEGAIEIKAAWKKLTECDDLESSACQAALERYHARELFVYYEDDSGGGTCSDESEIWGLVALHVNRKIGGQDPSWTFATWEHTDNVPPVGEEIPEGAKYSFYNPDCGTDGVECPDENTPPPTPEVGSYPDVDPSPYSPSQITRLAGPPDPTCRGNDSTDSTAPADLTELNRRARELMAGTPWANYELINIQWPNPDSESGGPQPNLLRNTVLESYILTGSPGDQQNVSNCYACHVDFAVTTDGCTSADSSWLLSQQAQCPAGTFPAADCPSPPAALSVLGRFLEPDSSSEGDTCDPTDPCLASPTDCS